MMPIFFKESFWKYEPNIYHRGPSVFLSVQKYALNFEVLASICTWGWNYFDLFKENEGSRPWKFLPFWKSTKKSRSEPIVFGWNPSPPYPHFSGRFSIFQLFGNFNLTYVMLNFPPSHRLSNQTRYSSLFHPENILSLKGG